VCRISTVSDDWAAKGCHVHVGNVEVSLHPDHLGGIVFDTPFSTTPGRDLRAAIARVKDALNDSRFRSQLGAAIRRAMAYMPGVVGYWSVKARGRLREFKFLLLALERWEGPG
jgi:hypothetical protein